MILSDLLLSAWILNTYNENDQKLYLTTLHLKSKLGNKGDALNEFEDVIFSVKITKTNNRSKT